MKGLEHTLRACEARAFRTKETLTPRLTDFFTDFEEKKPTVLQSSSAVKWCQTILSNNKKVY